MPIYKYKARDRDGLAITGELDIENQDILARKLDEMGYILISAEEAEEEKSNDIFAKFKKVKSKQLVEFSVQMSTLIDAGITLVGALEVMEDQQEDILFKKIIRNIRKDILAGITFSQALEKEPKAFSKFYCSMIKAGEASGQLDMILNNLAKFLENEESNKSKVKAALVYPATMLFVSIAVVIFLMTQILPKFEMIFSGSGIELPLPTKIVLGISRFMQDYWMYLLGGTIALIVGFVVYTKDGKGRYYFDKFKFKIPIFGVLIKKVAISRFSRTLGILIGSSVPILNSLEIVKDTVGNMAVAVVVENIKNTVREGGIISEQIELSGLFPIMVSKMVSVGEASGTLEGMLLKVADFYDDEVEIEIKALTSVIEPIMIVAMGLIIGVIVLSVMLPMFDMMKLAK
ncbi:MAG: type II secretion system F family protein [Fusobacteria bacterium]|nr:type II secretion system F family protein [Fusobacteriota bacterium]